MACVAQRWWWMGVAAVVWGSAASVCAAEQAAPARGQAGRGAADLREIRGALTSVDALNGRLTVEAALRPSKPAERITCVIDGETVISKYGVPLGIADLQPSGQRVKVQLIPQGEAMLLRRMTFEKPAGWQRFSGRVAAVDLLKGELTVRPTGLLWTGAPKVFAFNEQTLIAQGAHQRYLTDLRAGQEVRIEYLTEHHVPIATLVSLPEPPRGRGIEQAGGTAQPRSYTPATPVNP